MFLNSKILVFFGLGRAKDHHPGQFRFNSGLPDKIRTGDENLFIVPKTKKTLHAFPYELYPLVHYSPPQVIFSRVFFVIWILLWTILVCDRSTTGGYMYICNKHS